MLGISQEIWCSNQETGRFGDIPGKPGELASMCKRYFAGKTSMIQPKKFHTDDVTQCKVHNKSGSHGVPDLNYI